MSTCCRLFIGTLPNEDRNNRKSFTVGTHEGSSPFSYPRRSFHDGTGRSRDLSHEQFTWSGLRKKSQGLVAKIQTSLNSWDKSQGPELGPCHKILKQRWPVHVMGLDSCPRLVAGTSLLLCATHGVGVKVEKVGCRPLRLLNDFSASQSLLQLKFSRLIIIFPTFPVKMNCSSVLQI